MGSSLSLLLHDLSAANACAVVGMAAAVDTAVGMAMAVSPSGVAVSLSANNH